MIRMPRGKWWDILFIALAALLIWLVFGSGRTILDLEIGW